MSPSRTKPERSWMAKPPPPHHKAVDRRSNVERALDKISLREIKKAQKTVRFDRQRPAEGYTYLNWRPWDDVND